ncbi:MAG: hypothetical protein RBT49_07340 [Bacteroidales bacterium]|jgi:hypothetical protein|nr:hypothetical protein [Bacteroidales bacterium]
MMDLRDLRQSVLRSVRDMNKSANDVYYWVALSTELIQKQPKEFEFSVPSAKESSKIKIVKRTKDVTKEDMIINIFYSGITSLVSGVESFLNSIITTLLKYDTTRLKYTIKGMESDSTISVIDLIDYDKDELIDRVIGKKVDRLFYSSPSDYLLYIKKGLGIELKEETWKVWIELKAKRDLIVHNKGVVNTIYQTKIGDSSNTKIGDKIYCDLESFGKMISFVKKMVGEIYSVTKKIYNIPSLKKLDDCIN